jgi:predicted flap endonuclease-1-like 5' DNA nuclease
MRPPAPSMRQPGSTPAISKAASSTASFRPPEGGRAQELLAQLMSARKELAETGTELRKVTCERNALRIRVVQAENIARELASASRAEAELRAEFVDAHAASSAALRARISELEAALAAAHKQREPGEQLSLRQIRGIGPAYERGLRSLGITTVSQIAILGPDDLERIAPLIKARVDRILRDDWQGQAKRLLGE